jgi:hypothetical protein
VQAVSQLPHAANRLVQVNDAVFTFPPPAHAYTAREPSESFTLNTFEFHHYSHIWSVRAPGHRHRGSVLFREVRHTTFVVSQ